MPTEIKRMRYFDGLFLKQEEFRLDQDYNRRLRRLHNRHLHGFGIVWGLEVQNGPSASEVVVRPGMAIDLYDDPIYEEEIGREIMVAADVVVDLSGFQPSDGVYLWIRYDEQQADIVADRGGSEPIHWLETGVVETGLGPPPNPERNLLLGKVQLKSTAVEVDSILEQEGGQPLRTILSAGSGGGTTITGSAGKNYVRNPDAEAGDDNWTSAASATLTATRTGTAGEVLSGSFSFQITAIGSVAAETDYVTADLRQFDEEDINQLMSVEFSYKGLTDWDANYLQVIVHDITNNVDIVPNPAYVPGGQGKYRGVFTATDSRAYELRLVATQNVPTGYALAIDSVRVGPNDVAVGPAVGGWVDAGPIQWRGTTTDPDFTGATIVSNKFMYRRVGDSMEIAGYYEHTSPATTPAGGDIYVELPPGFHIASSANPSASLAANCRGTFHLQTNDSPGRGLLGVVQARDDRSLMFPVLQNNTTTNETNYFLWVAGLGINFTLTTVQISFQATVPIAEWSSDVVLSESRTEFVFNSDDGDQTNSTLTATGEQGALVPNLTASPTVVDNFIRKRCKLSRPYKHLRLEFNINGDTFWSSEKFLPENWQSPTVGNIYYGAYLDPISATEFDVVFQSLAHVSVVSRSGPAGSSSWSEEHAAGTRWRVVASDNPQFVETAPREYLAATSAIRTGSPGTGTFPELIGNSVVLTPGDWQLTGVGIVSNTGGINIGLDYMTVGWYAANGDNTNTEPLRFSSNVLGGRDVIDAKAPLVSQGNIPAATMLFRVTVPTEVFLVPLGVFSGNPAEVVYLTYITAVRMA